MGKVNKTHIKRANSATHWRWRTWATSGAGLIGATKM